MPTIPPDRHQVSGPGCPRVAAILQLGFFHFVATTPRPVDWPTQPDPRLRHASRSAEYDTEIDPIGARGPLWLARRDSRVLTSVTRPRSEQCGVPLHPRTQDASSRNLLARCLLFSLAHSLIIWQHGLLGKQDHQRPIMAIDQAAGERARFFVLREPRPTEHKRSGTSLSDRERLQARRTF